MRFCFFPLMFLGSCGTILPLDAADPPPIKKQTVTTFADGRRVVIEETTIPAPVRRVRIVEEPNEEVIFVRTIPVMPAMSLPVITYVYQAAPVYVPSAVYVKASPRVKPTPVRDFFFGR